MKSLCPKRLCSVIIRGQCRRSKSLCASKSRAVADDIHSKGSSGTETITESSARLEGKKLQLGQKIFSWP